MRFLALFVVASWMGRLIERDEICRDLHDFATLLFIGVLLIEEIFR